VGKRKAESWLELQVVGVTVWAEHDRDMKESRVVLPRHEVYILG